MQIISVGLNQDVTEPIGTIAKKNAMNFSFLEDYKEALSICEDHHVDGIIIDERNSPSNDSQLSQHFRLQLSTSLIPLYTICLDECVKKESFLPLFLDQKVSPPVDKSHFENWIVSLRKHRESFREFPQTGTLARYGILEILDFLNVRQKTGTLKLFADHGKEGKIHFQGGQIVDARARKLCAKEALFDVLVWKKGVFQFVDSLSCRKSTIKVSFSELLKEGLGLLKKAQILWTLIPDGNVILQRTDSESALADSAEDNFREKEFTFNLINGDRSIREIVNECPLSAPRALSFMANLVSMGDARPVSNTVNYQTRSNLSLPIKVLLVDDSGMIGTVLRKIFKNGSDFKVLGQAYNGREALEMIPELDPDVITLDVEMPEMDGISALKHIMIKYPRPVVMISSLTQEGSNTAFEALRYGAVDIIPKPLGSQEKSLETQQDEIIRKVKRASRVSVEALHFVRPKPVSNITGTQQKERKPVKVYAIGTGIGGNNALLQLIPALSMNSRVAYIIMTHFDELYLEPLANYLGQNSQLHIMPAKNTETLKSGCCYITTHGHYLTLTTSQDQSIKMHLQPAPFSQCADSSLDMLFLSVAETMGNKCGALVLSGTGKDGVQGMAQIARVGGIALVQKPESCLEPELPTKVLKAVSSVQVVSIREIPKYFQDEYMNEAEESRDKPEKRR